MSCLKKNTFTVLALVCTSAVQADSSIIEACRQTESLAARIACLEAALTRRDEAPTIQETTTAEPIAATEANVSSPLDTSPAQEQSMANSEIPAQQTVSTDETNEVHYDEPAQSTELGAEQVRTPEEREAALGNAQGLRVARYDVVPYRRLEVQLENGQVWRQIKGDTQKLRASLKKNQTVDIEESPLGGYKMRLNEMRRTIRVRRVR